MIAADGSQRLDQGGARRAPAEQFRFDVDPIRSRRAHLNVGTIKGGLNVNSVRMRP